MRSFQSPQGKLNTEMKSLTNVSICPLHRHAAIKLDTLSDVTVIPSSSMDHAIGISF